MHYIEVEKKFALPDPGPLKTRLKELGAEPDTPTHQVDTYYTAPHRDFSAPAIISEWLRVRIQDGASSINYKLWHPTNATAKTHADEYETKVEDVEAIRRLLDALNFPPLITVEKIRQAWQLPDVEVAFDHVAGAGSFVEFEFTGDAATVEQAAEQLEAFIVSLNVALGVPINRGYPHMLLNRER